MSTVPVIPADKLSLAESIGKVSSGSIDVHLMTVGTGRIAVVQDGINWPSMPNYASCPIIFGAEARWLYQTNVGTTAVTGTGQTVKFWRDVKGVFSGTPSGVATPDNAFSGTSNITSNIWGVNLTGSKGLQGTLVSSIAQPFTIICIAQRLLSLGGAYRYDGSTALQRAALLNTTSNNWATYGGTTTSPTIAEPGSAGYYSSVAIYNGASSTLNYNGSNTAATDIGNNAITGVTLGGRYSNEAIYAYSGIYRCYVLLQSINPTEISNTRAWLVNQFGAVS